MSDLKKCPICEKQTLEIDSKGTGEGEIYIEQCNSCDYFESFP